ncbi:MAG: hypothetical protein JXA04_04055 [Gammaproteobacteria bacterium]|nr:hypothetical protein [Gammaproteobacteria bacterium]
MRNNKLTAIVYAITFLLFFIVSACSKTAPEEAILANIQSMQEAAENKKPRAAVEYLSENFSGNRGIDKTSLRRIMAGIFLQHKNIHVVITRMDIEVNPQDPFSAQMDGVVILTGAENIFPQDGRVYQVTGEWQYQDDEWMLVRAQWK